MVPEISWADYAEKVISQGWCVFTCGTHASDPVTQAAIVSIVEDDDAVREALEDLVRAKGWAVLSFDSADAFLDSGTIDQTRFLISDVTMKGMSGIEMHAKLIVQGYSLPTIFITAYPNPQDEATALANGAIAYLEKPVGSNAILASIQQAMGKT
jgi:FixJ family two-component response regulator